MRRNTKRKYTNNNTYRKHNRAKRVITSKHKSGQKYGSKARVGRFSGVGDLSSTNKTKNYIKYHSRKIRQKLQTKTIKRRRPRNIIWKGGVDGFSEEKLIDRIIEYAKNMNDLQNTEYIKSLPDNYSDSAQEYFKNIQSLPVLMAIYSSIINTTKNDNTTTSGNDIPQNVLRNYVIYKIREIERTNPHPDLLNTLMYYFDLLDFPTAMAMVTVYLNKLTEQTPKQDTNGSSIEDHIEKNLAEYSSFDDWKAALEATGDTSNKMKFTYKTVSNNLNQYEVANSQLNALFSSPWTSFDPNITPPENKTPLTDPGKSQ